MTPKLSSKPLDDIEALLIVEGDRVRSFCDDTPGPAHAYRESGRRIWPRAELEDASAGLAVGTFGAHIYPWRSIPTARRAGAAASAEWACGRVAHTYLRPRSPRDAAQAFWRTQPYEALKTQGAGADVASDQERRLLHKCVRLISRFRGHDGEASVEPRSNATAGGRVPYVADVAKHPE